MTSACFITDVIRRNLFQTDVPDYIFKWWIWPITCIYVNL